MARPRAVLALACALAIVQSGLSIDVSGYGAGSGGSACPSACPSLPAQQRSAAALAVSLVAFVGCDGSLDGAARAMLTAASTGDADTFSAGMAIGAASLTGKDAAEGQMAKALSESFTVADSGEKAKAVASAVGNAMESMPTSVQAAMISESITAFNDLAATGQCVLAAKTAFEMYRALKATDTKKGIRGARTKFLSQCVMKGNSCWARRLLKLSMSRVFNKPPPSSPCTSYMRNASAVSVSLVSASACGLPDDKKIDAAAYALVTAAAENGCSFSSAVTSVSLAGLSSNSSIISIYQSAIPKAHAAGSSGKLANAFSSAMYEVVGVQGNASGLLNDILTAISGTIAASGCGSAKEFTLGVFTRMAAQDPSSKKELLAAFNAQPAIAKCNYKFT